MPCIWQSFDVQACQLCLQITDCYPTTMLEKCIIRSHLAMPCKIRFFKAGIRVCLLGLLGWVWESLKMGPVNCFELVLPVYMGAPVARPHKTSKEWSRPAILLINLPSSSEHKSPKNYCAVAQWVLGSTSRARLFLYGNCIKGHIEWEFIWPWILIRYSFLPQSEAIVYTSYTHWIQEMGDWDHKHLCRFIIACLRTSKWVSISSILMSMSL